MRVALLLLAVVGLFVPAGAWAGAWPREQGTWFLSLSYSGWGNGATVIDGINASLLGLEGSSVNHEGSAYLEYGLRPAATVGLDWFNRLGGAATESWAFARYHFSPPGQQTQIAAGLALGRVVTDFGDGGWGARLGAYGGRGFGTRIGPGWAELAVKAAWIDGTPDHYVKADALIGVAQTDRRRWLVAFQGGQYGQADPYLRIEPSAVFTVRDGISFQAGLTAGLINDDRLGLKVGTWLEF